MDDQFYLDDLDNYDNDDRYNEPIGSCELCGVNVYEDDAHLCDQGGYICDQCAWAISQANN